MNNWGWRLAFLLTLWLLLVPAALFFRPPMPVDETRYLAVAWEMWSQGDFVLPTLNGEAYSHKPPLLFWIIHAGWAAFGVNEWWPRLVAPLSLAGHPSLQGKEVGSPRKELGGKPRRNPRGHLRQRAGCLQGCAGVAAEEKLQ